jgi:type II secretory pathway pseudopilin PulG
MTHHPAAGRPRAGITMTEILISILIMGVGLTSVATLFPLGILRLREATRDSRSTLLAQSVIAESQARDLLSGQTFTHANLPWYAAWRLAGNGVANVSPLYKDLNGLNGSAEAADPGVPLPLANYASGVVPPGPGLPFAYDPLFWANLHYNTAGDPAPQTPLGLEARFGSGLGFLRDDPDGDRPSACGLQRLTNFRFYDSTVLWPLTYSLPTTPAAALPMAEVAGDVFTSLDDVLFQPEGEDGNANQGSSPLVPFNYNTAGGFSYDREYAFSWMLTGRQVAWGDSAAVEADIVVFHNRPLGLTQAFAPAAGTQVTVPEGDRVVEAVWGHTGAGSAVNGAGYSTSDDYTVLLRWPTASNDLRLKAGNWIADVTYERTIAGNTSRYGPAVALYPGQRCHWYRIAQVSQIEPDPAIADHRRMIVRVETPLKAKTRLQLSGTQVVPVHVEAALLNGYIVNVFPTVLHSR